MSINALALSLFFRHVHRASDYPDIALSGDNTISTATLEDSDQSHFQGGNSIGTIRQRRRKVPRSISLYSTIFIHRM
ncbi:hypothetical protein PSP6_250135 [Paraburkholderia tropica]|nr:hypothetical protein PSP6_250135 [Paraburkholderia tropica]